MTFNLVDRWYDARGLDDGLQLFHVEIGYTDSSDLFRLFRDPDNLFPSLRNRRCVFINDDRLPIGRGGGQFIGGLKGDWPVDEPYV